jgi:hypothetical protein
MAATALTRSTATPASTRSTRRSDDQLIAIGGTPPTASRRQRFRLFWVDNSLTETVADADMTETANGAVHKVTTFRNVTARS